MKTLQDASEKKKAVLLNLDEDELYKLEKTAEKNNMTIEQFIQRALETKLDAGGESEKVAS